MIQSAQIIPHYAHPHVHTVIFDNTMEDQLSRSTSTEDLPFSTCVVTGADQGIDNTFIRLSDLRTKVSLFGRGNYTKYGQSSLQADQLFNGRTNVWFCRVLPDNATYANMILLAHFRKGNILDELNQETGKVRLEMKYSWVNATKPVVADGTKTDADIQEFAKSLTNLTPDPQTGYMTVPIMYIRAVGRGRYGNNYSIRMGRDSEAEREFQMKMYRFTLLENSSAIRVMNMFTGTLTQGTRNDMSTLIDDVIDQFPTGSAPIIPKTFSENFEYIYRFYQEKIVDANEAYMSSAGASTLEIRELKSAKNMTVEQFDPIFGLVLNTRTNLSIPYYRNYTVMPGGPWVNPAFVVPNETGAQKPLNMADWNTAFIGANVLMISDPLNEGRRWMYQVIHIDTESGNITYNEGHEIAIDADQYDGIDIQLEVGHRMIGGHDGDFQEISIEGTTRPPTAAEMIILLSREYVKAFRGEKDRKILSPSRVNLDFMFDANYNMTNDLNLDLDKALFPLYNYATVITNEDNTQIAILGSDDFLINYSDLNVKRAMWDLNEFRNRNGMTVDSAEGAGCLLYLDMGLIGLRNISVNSELNAVMKMMEGYDGRNTAIDLGHYEIYDPYTSKRIPVTATYFIACNLTNHLTTHGMNKPFVFNYATIRALERNSRNRVTSGSMIRDSFRPDIDLIDWDVKEQLFMSRINYYLTNNEGRQVQRAVQNTRQKDPSALLEENNVRVLNSLKKGIERACRGYLYEWNEPEVRAGFTLAQMEIYRPWIGTMVDNLEIMFTANEWEEQRSIMRCLVYVSFRNIIKRIILEINIMRPDHMPVLGTDNHRQLEDTALLNLTGGGN